MTRERKLKQEAVEAMRQHGHKPYRRWLTFGLIPQLEFERVCQRCGRAAWVQVRPTPNSSEVSGEATEMACGEPHQSAKGCSYDSRR
jgi:hypothetical protein